MNIILLIITQNIFKEITNTTITEFIIIQQNRMRKEKNNVKNCLISHFDYNLNVNIIKQ